MRIKKLKHCKVNFKDQIYLEKTKNPQTQRMGFYISRHLPGIKSTDYKIIFIEDIFVQISTCNEELVINPLLFGSNRVTE